MLTGPRTLGNLARMIEPGTTPRVVAAVLNWCAEYDTAACVQSLIADGYRPLDILIVDNGSPDGSGDRLHSQFPSLHYLQNGENLGYAGGNLKATNWALERGYDYLLVINDDAEVACGCIAQLVNTLESNPRAAAAAPTILHHGTSTIWFAGGEFVRFKAIGTHTRFGQETSALGKNSALPKAVSFISGCAVLYRCRALRQSGGFRAEFFSYVEDLELSVRLMRNGWILCHVPSARATHKVSYPPPTPSPFAIRLRDRNRRRLVSLHYSGFDKLAFSAWFYPTRLLHLLRYLATGDAPRAAAIWSGMLD